MGSDKAFLKLAGKPLVQHAVVKLRRLCMQVAILGSDPALGTYGPLVEDLRPQCGPMGGMEAALLHAQFDWSLFLPVDVPFVPTAYLDHWVRGTLNRSAGRGARVLMFSVGGRPQPTLALIHREVRPFLSEALDAGRYKLFPALEEACRELSLQAGLLPGVGLWNLPYSSNFRSGPGLRRNKEAWCYTTEAQERSSGMWFNNVNTPQEFAEAEAHADVLDT